MYKFIGHILPDGHLTLPDDLAGDTGNAFEVTMKSVNDIQNKASLYLQGKLEKKHRLADINLPADEIAEDIARTYGTSNIDEIIRAVRK